jgi:hypothetical protein
MKDALLEMDENYLVFRADENTSAIRLPILICLSLVIVSSLSLMPNFIMSVWVIVVVWFLTEINLAMIFKCFISSRYVLFDHSIEVLKKHFYIDRLLHQDSSISLLLTANYVFVSSDLVELKLKLLAFLREDLDFIL